MGRLHTSRAVVLRMKRGLSALFVVVLILATTSILLCRQDGCIESTTGTISGRATTAKLMATGSSSGSRFIPLSQSEIDGVEKFVLFIGYGRSGHSFIGAMMDAHPNIIIANEYHVLQQCVLNGTLYLPSKASLFNGLYDNSYRISKHGGRSAKSNKTITRGYDLHINTPWQGSFNQLRVIGDKNGGDLSNLFVTYPAEATKCLNLLKETINIPIVILHVIRNPFDMIATRLALNHEMTNIRKTLLTGWKLKLTKEEVMSVAKTIFRKAEAIEAITSDATNNFVVVEIHSENFIKHPQEHINKICQALGVPCPVEYVEACHEKVFKTISKSRQIIEWDDNVVKRILTMMKPLPFFSAYTLDSEGS